MNSIRNGILRLGLCFLLVSCGSTKNENGLFEKFQQPDSYARPMVRWWWNGNAVEATEIKRELAVLNKAGIGGVEINSIQMPSHAKKTNSVPLQWAGKEWCDMVKTASLEAKELGMVADLIVGSGWPFGGKFLQENETIQRLNIKRKTVEANSIINIDLDKYLSSSSPHTPASRKIELLSAKLIPVNINSIEEIIDITSEVENNTLIFKTGERDYELAIVFNERNFRSVSVGSPGADGPIMDHFQTEVVRSYLNRLLVVEKETGLSLSELIRALFCDSIELGEANWTDDMKELFISNNGYDVTPWLPFIIQPFSEPNKYKTSPELSNKINRVQYDFYNTVISVFLERFTAEFQRFCTENEVLCRYQAYGHPFYMGLFQGNIIPDIPESNNWIYSRGRNEADSQAYTWVQNHGYMLWNKAASSAANITGKTITSCEAMTNTSGVFRTSLETIKQSDDMNFITGINHSVLHGFNYSPPEAGFPGWIRFGAYFSEHNTWWKYFKHWANYNARLSAVFQNSKAESEIAVLGRLRDLWGEVGLNRTFLNDKPWYYARLWEPISNLGASCDYIHQPVLETAEIEGKNLLCGEMSYKTIWLTNVESLTPAAAQKLQDFADAGGSVVFIGESPRRSLSFKDAEKNDRLVQEAVQRMLKKKNVLVIPAPEESGDFIQWTNDLLNKISIDSPIRISDPISYLYTLKKTADEKDVYFFVNAHRKKSVDVEVILRTGNKFPNIWMPKTGERFAYPVSQNNKLHLSLDALESVLIIFEPVNLDLPTYTLKSPVKKFSKLSAAWDVNFEHVNGTTFNRKMDHLIDFKDAEDEAILTFAGTVVYTTKFENPDHIKSIRLSNTNEAVTELFVNGKYAGMKWYGRHQYDVGKLLKADTNEIKIVLTTTLANYCRSLKNNPAAQAWAGRYKDPFSSGLMEVELGD